MPTFKIRLEDPNSDEFRLCAIPAASEAEAIAELLRREQKKVDYRLTTAEMAACERGPTLPSDDPEYVPASTARARLLTHHQAVPYEVVSVEPYEGGFWKAAREAKAAKKKGGE